jgi:hypothetical protein
VSEPVDMRYIMRNVVHAYVYSLVGSVASVPVSLAVYWPTRDVVDWDVGTSVRIALREELSP